MKFRAAVLHAAGTPLQIETVVCSETLSLSDVLVRVEACGICHTDLEVAGGEQAFPLPLILGHEVCGVVADVGPHVSRVRHGDRVVLSWNPHCGSCFYCQRNQPILCDVWTARMRSGLPFDGNPRLALQDGLAVHPFMFLGGFAEYCVVDEQSPIPIPPAVPAETACLIGCAVATGVCAARNVATIEQGENVAIVGCGAVGLSAVLGARLSGAGSIFALDPDPRRRLRASAYGATNTFDPLREDLVSCVRSLTEGRGADCVLEAAGTPDAFRLSLDLARPGARIVWLGKRPPDEGFQLRFGALMGEKRLVRSSYGGARPQADFPYLAETYLTGELPIDTLVSERFQLSQVNEGLRAVRQGELIRGVLTP